MYKQILKKVPLKAAKPGKPTDRGELLQYYYFTDQPVSAKELSLCIRSVAADHLEVWRELNILEVVLGHDSLVFQDAREVFEDPEDLKFLEEHHITSLYTTDYNSLDEAAAFQVYKEILTAFGGMLCSDTDDFTPMWVLSEENTIKRLDGRCL